MNILLIYPEFPDTFWSFKHALKFVRRKSVSPPLGLLTIAAMLPRDWSKRLVDLNIAPPTPEDLAWADYAFVSGMVVQRQSAHAIVDQCKAAGVRIVAGGPLFSSEYEMFESVDHFVLGEAEITLPLFLNDLAQGHPQRVYNTSEFADIHETPVPMWELADFRKYATMNIQYSRGCPFDCDFCNITVLFGHRPRTKTAPQMIAELDKLYGLGWRGSVFFVDDNLIGNKKCLKTELLPALIEWNKDKHVTLSTEISINFADDPVLMQMMVSAGFESVFVGIETPNADSLSESNKKQNLKRDLIEDVKRIQRAGIQVQAGFIVGFDNDTPAIFHQQIEFIQRSGIMNAMVGLLQAIPGTRLYERMKQAGRLLEPASGDNVDGTTNIAPLMGLETLQRGYKALLGVIYSPRPYYTRLRTFLRDFRLGENKGSLTFDHLYAFGRSILMLGILGKERFEYWRLFFWTLFSRPRKLPVAVTMAIYGYHFRRVCELRVF